MIRLLFIFIVTGVIVAFVVILGSILGRGRTEARRMHLGPLKDGTMAPTQLQRIAYVALIVLLFGTASGWLGGM